MSIFGTPRHWTQRRHLCWTPLKGDWTDRRNKRPPRLQATGYPSLLCAACLLHEQSSIFGTPCHRMRRWRPAWMPLEGDWVGGGRKRPSQAMNPRWISLLCSTQLIPSCEQFYLWNSLPQDVEVASSLGAFKRGLGRRMEETQRGAGFIRLSNSFFR